MNRYIQIDIARAIGIILVVVGHYFPDKSPDWYVGLHDIIYSFHMPLFMFLSGFVYIAFKKQESYIGFLTKKVKRLIVPYLVTSFLVISLKLFTQSDGYVGDHVTIISYLKMFYRPEAGIFLWFIWTLWWIFVIVPIFKSKKSRVAFLVFSILLHYAPIPMPD